MFEKLTEVLSGVQVIKKTVLAQGYGNFPHPISGKNYLAWQR